MIRSNHLRRMLERCLAVSFAQAGNARSAASTACVASARAHDRNLRQFDAVDRIGHGIGRCADPRAVDVAAARAAARDPSDDRAAMVAEVCEVRAAAAVGDHGVTPRDEFLGTTQDVCCRSPEYRLKQAAMHRPRRGGFMCFEANQKFTAGFRMIHHPPQSRDSGIDASERAEWQSRSGRATHIGFATADHALRCGLGVRLRGGGAGTIIEVGHRRRFASSEP